MCSVPVSLWRQNVLWVYSGPKVLGTDDISSPNITGIIRSRHSFLNNATSFRKGRIFHACSWLVEGAICPTTRRAECSEGGDGTASLRSGEVHRLLVFIRRGWRSWPRRPRPKNSPPPRQRLLAGRQL